MKFIYQTVRAEFRDSNVLHFSTVSGKRHETLHAAVAEIKTQPDSRAFFIGLYEALDDGTVEHVIDYDRNGNPAESGISENIEKIVKAHDRLREGLAYLRDEFSEKRSDVSDITADLLNGKEYRHGAEHRYVRFWHNDTMFVYDTLTTLVEAVDVFGNVKVLECQYYDDLSEPGEKTG